VKEGELKKICRKGDKPRIFFLFNGTARHAL
jgi:hypothetical protein